MKKVLAVLLICALALTLPLPVYAEDGFVTYDGDSREFIFDPGTEHSPTDLFPDFKDVMPGDVLTQKITVKNDASQNVKVKIYLRSLGAQEGSEEFLSQLNLKVKLSDDNEMAYMFDAAANETAQLTQWVYLGELYSGGEVNLNWEFKVEEFPVDSDDPKPPATGDDTRLELWVAMMAGSLALMFIILFLLWRKREEEDAEQ